jgi:hypothetical protein
MVSEGQGQTVRPGQGAVAQPGRAAGVRLAPARAARPGRAAVVLVGQGLVDSVYPAADQVAATVERADWADQSGRGSADWANPAAAEFVRAARGE